MIATVSLCTAGLFVLCAGLIYLQIVALTTPFRIPVVDTPDGFPYPTQTVTFTTTDEVSIEGWYVAGTRPQAMILVHGVNANRQAMMAETRILAETGYHLLLFDLRGHGNSGQAKLTYGYNEARDVLAAVEYLDSLPDIEQIGILGNSLGGSAVAHAAAEDSRLQAVIVQSSFTSLSHGIDDAFNKMALLPEWPFQPLIIGVAEWRTGVRVGQVDSAAALSRVAPRPVLIIHGTRDDMFPLAHAERLYAAAQEPKTLWLVEGLGHVNVAAVDADAFKLRVLPFLEAAWQ